LLRIGFGQLFGVWLVNNKGLLGQPFAFSCDEMKNKP
jgi:hypothetical protein